ncbi:MAG: tyrosine-protein phosphatase [Sarcina sp.]
MIDLHTHIIPEIDDGSKTEEMTLEMLKIAEKSGTKKIVLTPHYFKGKYMVPLNEVKQKLIYLKDLSKDNGINIELFCGQEVYFTPSILEDFKNGVIGTINNSKYMLIEFNLSSFDYELNEILDILYELKIRGVVPIIAHPERYKDFQKNPEKINDFIEIGCLFQMNAGSITGSLGSDSKKLAKILLKNRIYSFIGSDAHNTGRRGTNVLEHKKEIETIEPNFFDKTIKNSDKLLLNEDVYFTGNNIKKKIFGIF